MSNLPTAEVKSLVYHIAVNNSESAYKKLFFLLFNSLFRLAFCMTRSRELAEEVASDVLFKLWQKRWELLTVENVPVYALTIARNLSLNVIKQQVSNRMLSLDSVGHNPRSPSSNPEELMIGAQNKTVLEQAVNALPTRCRLVFKLIKDEGLSYREVAMILNISPKTVDAHLVTAMRKLADALKPSLYNS